MTALTYELRELSLASDSAALARHSCSQFCRSLGPRSEFRMSIRLTRLLNPQSAMIKAMLSGDWMMQQ
jgi:hypothetical protein